MTSTASSVQRAERLSSEFGDGACAAHVCPTEVQARPCPTDCGGSQIHHAAEAGAYPPLSENPKGSKIPHRVLCRKQGDVDV